MAKRSARAPSFPCEARNRKDSGIKTTSNPATTRVGTPPT